MSRRGAAPPPDARELGAAALAALADALVLAAPVHLLLAEAGGMDLSIWVFVPAFALVYAAGTLATCLFRSSRSLAIAAFVTVGILGLAIGEGELGRSSIVPALVALVLALRVVSLGVRSWRAPLEGQLALGTAILGVEAVAGAAGRPGWGPLLIVCMPMFFIAALASRAITVWSGSDAVELDERSVGPWIRSSVLATAGLLGAMAGAVAFAVRGGPLERAGELVGLGVDSAIPVIVFAVTQVARPFFWLVERITGSARDTGTPGLPDPGFGSVIEDEARRPGGSLLLRLLGLLALSMIALALYGVMRRLRPGPGIPADEPRRPRQRSAPASEPLDRRPPLRGGLRRELPSDAVRRWYAEILLALRMRELPKEPSQTPAEYAPQVVATFPECGEGFEELTRTYQDVRYGGMRPDDRALGRLRQIHREILRTLRRTR